MLHEVSQALASIEQLTVDACEEAFNCQLQRDQRNPNQYWGEVPAFNIETLDIRIGERAGIIVASFDADMQMILATELVKLPHPVAFDIVSPPIDGIPRWQRKWSVGYMLFGAKIYFGLEKIDDVEYLIYASRNFDSN